MIVIERRGPASPTALERPRPAAQRRLLRRRRGHGRFASPVVARAPTTQKAAEDATETPSEEAVDDEVGRRVDDDQQIAEM